MLKGLFCLIMIAIAGAAPAAAQTTTKVMSFEACLATIQYMATKLGAPTNIVETSILRIVRFPATDGSVLMTCSAPDQKMVLTQTDNVCGVDVEC
jgi:hypothetical protein